MGRVADLCGDVAAAAEEGPEGLVLPLEAWDKLRDEWWDEEIEDALGLVKDSCCNGTRRGGRQPQRASRGAARTWGEAKAWAAAVEGHAAIPLAAIRQLAHRLDRLEEILELYRDRKGPDHRRVDKLQRHLIDQGIEKDMRPDWEQDADEPEGEGGA